jgi:hypothetical protein
VPVVLDVQFRRFGRAMCRVMQVTLRRVRVVSGCLVIAILVIPGGFAVVLRRFLVVLRCFVVVLRCLFRHSLLQTLQSRAAGRH